MLSSDMNPPPFKRPSPGADGASVMIGSDFWTRPSRDSLDSADSRRGSLDGAGHGASSPAGGAGTGGASSPSAQQQQQQQQQHQQQQQQRQRGRFWGIAPVDCTAAPFSA
jgi:hypothetical protein